MKVNYPNQKKQINKTTTHSQRGMALEHALNISNEYYRNKNIAVIYKKPTPIQIVKVDYPKRESAKITEAYYQSKSTTDYNGIYKGKYIDYEAKETTASSFNFSYIFKHQLDHLKLIKEHGGLAFVLVYFKKFGEAYILDIDDFLIFHDLALKGNRKSIPLSSFQEKGKKIELGYAPPVDYLKSIDELYIVKA